MMFKAKWYQNVSRSVLFYKQIHVPSVGLIKCCCGSYIGDPWSILLKACLNIFCLMYGWLYIFSILLISSSHITCFEKHHRLMKMA